MLSKNGLFISRAFRWVLRLLAKSLIPVLPGTSLAWGPPRRFSKTYKQWLNCAKNNSNSSLAEIYPPTSFENINASSIDNLLPYNLKCKATISINSQFVAEINRGRVVGIDPVILTNDDTIIGDLSLIFTPYIFDIFFNFKLVSAQSFSGLVLVLAGAPGSNYGHWLHQMLPRLHLAQRAGFKPSDFDKVIINSTSNNFGEESLIAAGFINDQLIQSCSNLHVKAERLIVPSFPPSGNPPTWVPEFLRSTYGTSTAKPVRRIYTSRANAKWRKIINEKDLYPVLLKFGFEIVYPEKLSFMDGVHLFETSEIVCGMHGANLSNICFCMPGSTLIEIYHPQHPEIYYWTTASSSKLNYAFILGEGSIRDYPDNTHRAIGNHSDTIVSPRKLQDIFISLGL